MNLSRPLHRSAIRWLAVVSAVALLGAYVVLAHVRAGRSYIPKSARIAEGAGLPGVPLTTARVRTVEAGSTVAPGSKIGVLVLSKFLESPSAQGDEIEEIVEVLPAPDATPPVLEKSPPNSTMVAPGSKSMDLLLLTTDRTAPLRLSEPAKPATAATPPPAPRSIAPGSKSSIPLIDLDLGQRSPPPQSSTFPR